MIWSYTVCKGRTYPGSAGQGLKRFSYLTGPTYPSGEAQKTLLLETYKEAGIDPKDLTYIEAHATGTMVGDPIEANAICDALCGTRKEPLLIGSVKSNIGHCESASGKVFLCFDLCHAE